MSDHYRRQFHTFAKEVFEKRARGPLMDDTAIIMQLLIKGFGAIIEVLENNER